MYCSRMWLVEYLASWESLTSKVYYDCVHLMIKVREFSVFIVTGDRLGRDKGLPYSERLG